MAVFWFGWAKKLKNVFTKKAADTYYLQKELPNQLQIVKGNVDFYKNVVIKQNGYVDNVDTNARNSMINKRYLDNNTLSKTFEADINEVKRLTKLNTYNDSSNSVASNWSVIANTVDFTRPVYISFKQSNYDSGVILKSYNYVVNFLEENNWYYLNDNVSIKYFSRNNSYRIEWKSSNLPSREVLGYITLKYTPKTL